MVLRSVALVGLLVVACGAYAAANDIGGVKTGLPLAAQRAAIEKINPKYKFGEIKNAEGKVVGLEAVAYSAKDKSLNDQFLALQDEAGNVWYLGRVQAYEEEGFIPQGNYISALKEKYGAPSVQYSEGRTQKWSYDRSGALQPDKSDSACPNSITDTGTDFSKLAQAGMSMPIPRRFAPKCGIQILSVLTIDGRNNLVRGSSIVIVDNKPRFEELAKQQAQADAAKQKGLDAVKDNKPKL